jgi:hypothetical protein
MHDDEINLCNACTDLVSLRTSEAFPRQLLENKRPGEWIGVRAFCEQIGIAPGDVKPELFATWLPDPTAQDGYAVVLFYDDESKWSMAAHYNRGRLLDSARPNQVQWPSGGSIPASGSTSQQATPAAEV